MCHVTLDTTYIKKQDLYLHFHYETIEYKQTEKAPTPIGRSTQGAETYTGWGFKSPEEVCSLHIMVAAQAERTVSTLPKLRRNKKIKNIGSRRSPQWVLTDNS